LPSELGSQPRRWSKLRFSIISTTTTSNGAWWGEGSRDIGCCRVERNVRVSPAPNEDAEPTMARVPTPVKPRNALRLTLGTPSNVVSDCGQCLSVAELRAAVQIAERVQSFAPAGEVFVSETVPRLVAGSGIDFADHGEHELKGVPGSWRLYSVAR
jgi:hypothetical protein